MKGNSAARPDSESPKPSVVAVEVITILHQIKRLEARSSRPAWEHSETLSLKVGQGVDKFYSKICIMLWLERWLSG